MSNASPIRTLWIFMLGVLTTLFCALFLWFGSALLFGAAFTFVGGLIVVVVYGYIHARLK